MSKRVKPISPSDLAQRITDLLGSARFDTTYKLATLEAIILLVGRTRTPGKRLVNSFSARDVSNLVLERYWAQAIPYAGSNGVVVAHLRQKQTGGGDLVSRIASTRSMLGLTSRSDTLIKARKISPADVNKLERLVWERVVDMPIPRLQRFGNAKKHTEDRFLYEYQWRSGDPKQHLRRARLNDSLTLQPGVAEGLLILKPLLLLHIETLWMNLVAEWNPQVTDAAKLREILFEEPRTSTASLRSPLLNLQNGLCFYCGQNAGKNFEVDHFLPYSLGHNESVENFVVACRKCNASKSASLPALRHLKKWRKRLDPTSPTSRSLAALATGTSRPFRPNSTISEAWSAYKYAGPGKLLWLADDTYETIDLARVLKVIG